MLDITTIRQLLILAPRPPEDPIPLGVSESDCTAFEQRTGMQLPTEVREWLKLTNGPCVGPGGLFGIRPARANLDIEMYLQMFPSWRVKGWIPIAGDGCGNYYVIPTQQEYGSGYPVVFIDTSSSPDHPEYIVASDLEHFIIGLIEAELGKNSWPFNENFMADFDPRITTFNGVDSPWMTG